MKQWNWCKMLQIRGIQYTSLIHGKLICTKLGHHIGGYLPSCLRACASERLRSGKMGNKKHATCFAILLQNKLKSNVVRFTTHIKPVLQQIRLLTGLNLVVKWQHRHSTRFTAMDKLHVFCCRFFWTFKQSHLHQMANAYLYHVTKFPLYLSFTVHYFYT